MKFVDEARVYVQAGNGGNGCVSFRREKFVPRGGPNGGNGGKGGDVLLFVDSNLSTLLDFHYQRHYKAKRGQHGKGKDQDGRDAPDLVLRVPAGTVVKDGETSDVLGDLTVSGRHMVIAKGGKGGRGNKKFATSTNRAPRIAEQGELGEKRWIVLELKLIADVGIIGFPNAGKSTLISRISSARPKIADYPFTTLVPNLGVVRHHDGKDFVVADLPGLIEGAHKGSGLGIQFLRHIERTRLSMHMLDLSDLPSREPIQDYLAVMKEMGAYDPSLPAKPQVIALNKIDLPEARGKVSGLISYFKRKGIKAFPISAATGEGIKPLLDEVTRILWS